MEPVYAEDIIVGLTYQKKFHWFLTENGFWKLDYDKAAVSMELLVDHEREDIEILNENTIEKFLKRISQYEVKTSQLKEQFLTAVEIDQKNALYDYRPSLYINFDQKILYSQYPEYISYEEYVPDHWQGFYENFYHRIDEEFKYWCIDTIDYLERK